jgi:3-hydroxyisobutyrate dehydrogenase-like beta-hydroxyacid dehydrogenase
VARAREDDAEGDVIVRIAFFGTGNMGEPMALNLIRAGHEVAVYNRTRERAEPLAKAGARVADSPADAVKGVEVAITMLANDHAVRETLFAAIGSLDRGAVHMCTSTISVAFSKELAQEHAARGQGYVASPVLGRPEAAAEKKLWVLAAGPQDQVARCRPLMEAIGRGISIMGDEPWQANLTKIGANFMLASMLEAMAEAFALVRKSGIDSHAFLEILTGVFNSPVYTNYGQIVADRQFDPAGFRLTLGLKDVGLALAAAEDTAVPLPLASLIRDHYLSAIAHGRADADWSALAEVAARNAGL